MALIRWEPAREATSLQSLFNSFFDTPTTARPAAPRRFVPATDLVETPEQYVLRADLPGVAPADVELSLEGRVLTLSGTRHGAAEDRTEGRVRVERSFGSFRRTVTLPEGVDGEAISATYDNGVLEIAIPKPEARKPRKLEIKVGEQPAAIEGGEPQAA